MNKHTLTVGQKLWYVASNRPAAPHEVTVTSVGRKWAGIGHGNRIALDTLYVDGGQYVSPGRCWISREEWEVDAKADEAWRRFRRATEAYQRPEGATAEVIARAAEVLGIKLEVNR